MAMDAGSSKAVNVVLMGVLAQHMDLSRDVWDRALEETVPQNFGDEQAGVFLGL